MVQFHRRRFILHSAIERASARSISTRRAYATTPLPDLAPGLEIHVPLPLTQGVKISRLFSL